MALRALGGLAVVLTATSPTQALDAACLGPTAPDAEGRAISSIVIENDVLAGTDRNYTSGLRYERIAPEADVSPWLRRAAMAHPLIDMSGCEIRQGWALSHRLYTPSDITAPVADPDDHPYAAHLSLQWFASARAQDREHRVMVDIGWVGPSVGGELVQRRWHKLIDGQNPRGWDAQLRDEPVFAISGQHVRRLGAAKWEGLDADWLGYAGLTLGTLRTDASIGAAFRIGAGLDADFAPPRLRPAIVSSSVFAPNGPRGGYVFASLGGYAIGRDIFLDGNTFRDSASVSRDAFVVDVQGGGVVHAGRWRAALTLVARTEEFRGQDGAQRFGALSFSRIF